MDRGNWRSTVYGVATKWLNAECSTYHETEIRRPCQNESWGSGGDAPGSFPFIFNYETVTNSLTIGQEKVPVYSSRCKHFLLGSKVAFKARQWYVPMFYVTLWHKCFLGKIWCVLVSYGQEIPDQTAGFASCEVTVIEPPKQKRLAFWFLWVYSFTKVIQLSTCFPPAAHLRAPSPLGIASFWKQWHWKQGYHMVNHGNTTPNRLVHSKL